MKNTLIITILLMIVTIIFSAVSYNRENRIQEQISDIKLTTEQSIANLRINLPYILKCDEKGGEYTEGSRITGVMKEADGAYYVDYTRRICTIKDTKVTNLIDEEILKN